MRRLAVCLVAFGALLSATDSHAQAGPVSLEFSFSNPGARSMGFGGAFVALADDATAAFANPAGLYQLARPEVSIEGRYWRYDTPYTEGGRLNGDPTGLGLDTTGGLRFGMSEDDVAGQSFLSFVFPVKKTSVALYRHQLSKFASTLETQGFFFDPPGGPTDRLSDFRVHTDLDIVTYGISAAFRLSDAFSVGLGISYFEADIVFRNEEFAVQDPTDPVSLFGPNPYLADRRVVSTETVTNDSDWKFIAGFVWHVGERFRIGSAYRAGPEFEMDVSAVAGPLLDPGVPPGTVIGIARTPLELPDVLALGLTYRSRSEALTLSFEWDRVEYSTITESLDRDVFDDLPIADDADELRAGLEYVFSRTEPVVAVRFGIWRDPDHRLRATDDATLFEQAFFQPGGDEFHVAAGAGFVWRSVQLDVGVDSSDVVDTASASVIYRF